MNTVGNILWFFLGGFLIVLFYVFGSLLLFLSIVGIPFGLQTLKMGMFAMSPFGKEAIPGTRASGCLYVIFNILWIIFAGVEIAVTHLILALLFAITIVGIPFARQHLKMAGLGLIPFGMNIKNVSDDAR